MLLRNLKDQQFFKQFIKDFNNEEEIDPFIYICKNIKLLTYEPGEPVLKQGDLSDGNVYLVFSGELLVMAKSLNFLSDGAAGNIAKEQNKFSLSIKNIAQKKLKLDGKEDSILPDSAKQSSR